VSAALGSVGAELSGTFKDITRDITGVLSTVVILGVLMIVLPILTQMADLVGQINKQPTTTGERSFFELYYWDAEKKQWVFDPLGLGPQKQTTATTSTPYMEALAKKQNTVVYRPGTWGGKVIRK